MGDTKLTPPLTEGKTRPERPELLKVPPRPTDGPPAVRVTKEVELTEEDKEALEWLIEDELWDNADLERYRQGGCAGSWLERMFRMGLISIRITDNGREVVKG